MMSNSLTPRAWRTQVRRRARSFRACLEVMEGRFLLSVAPPTDALSRSGTSTVPVFGSPGAGVVGGVGASGPQVAAGPNATLTWGGAPLSRHGSFTDTYAGPWTATVSYGD